MLRFRRQEAPPITEKYAPDDEEALIEDVTSHPLIRKIQATMQGASFEEVVRSLAVKDPYIWTMLKRRLKGKTTTFNAMRHLREMQAQGKPPTIRDLVRHRPFLIEPLRDQTKYKTYMKGRQVGISETTMTEELWFLDSHPNTKAVHTFPREKQLLDFSNTRITEALVESPEMMALLGTPNQTMTKRIGQSYLFLRSAWEANLGEGIDIDLVVFDERDRMKEGIEVAFKESLSASPYGLTRDVSTPSIPNRGVDISWQRSNQKEWHVRCTSCGLEQVIYHDKNIVQMVDLPENPVELPQGAYEYRCHREKCRGRLDRTTGRWIAKYPDRKLVAGYWIPQLIAPWISATEVMQKKLDYKFLSLWLNYVIGIPTLGDSPLITEDDFYAAQSNYKFPIPRRTRDFDRISVGIDWGGQNYVTIYGRNKHNGLRYLLNAFSVADTSNSLESTMEIIAALKPYQPESIVGDAGYGKDRNELIYKHFPSATYFCRYNPASQKRATSLNPSWSELTRQVLVDKTLTVKVTCRLYRMLKIGLPMIDQHPQVKLLVEHFGNLALVRQEEEGETWEEMARTGPDHYAQASNYAMLGMDHLEGGTEFSFGFF